MRLFLMMILAAFALPAFAETRYPVEVVKCHDADTCTVRGVPMPEPLPQEWKIRFANIQAPELRGSKCPTAEGRAHESRLAWDATVYVRQLVLYPKAYVGLVGMGGFNRLLGRLYVEDDGQLIDVGRRLVDVGLAKPWDGRGEKPTFCE